MISEMQKYLSAEKLGRNVFCFNALDSTSTYIRNLWQQLPDGHVCIAAEQLSGRGRSGKTFYSPKGEGLYFSFLLKDEKYLNDPLLTVKMSYALCKAIDRITETEAVTIKWVNDIYFENKKLAGILCEALNENGKSAVLVGMGINFNLNKGEIPTELRGKIGSLHDVVKKDLSKEQLAAYILNEVEAMYSEEKDKSEFLALYRTRSLVLGHEIKVLKNNEFVRAAALDISDDGGLTVRYENGITEKLTAGEISITMD